MTATAFGFPFCQQFDIDHDDDYYCTRLPITGHHGGTPRRSCLCKVARTYCLLGHTRLLERVRCRAHGQGGDGILLGCWSRGAWYRWANACHISCCMIALQQQLAQQVLTQFQDNPEAWTRVPDILERSSFPQTKVCTFDLLLRPYP